MRERKGRADISVSKFKNNTKRHFNDIGSNNEFRRATIEKFRDKNDVRIIARVI